MEYLSESEIVWLYLAVALTIYFISLQVYKYEYNYTTQEAYHSVDNFMGKWLLFSFAWIPMIPIVLILGLIAITFLVLENISLIDISFKLK